MTENGSKLELFSSGSYENEQSKSSTKDLYLGVSNDVNKEFSRIEISSSSSSDPVLLSNSSTYSKNLREREVSIYANNLISFIISDDFFEGEISKSQMYIEKIYHDDPDLFQSVFEVTWLELFKLSKSSLYTFVSISSNIPYEWLGAKADTLILSCSSHSDPGVNEACLRCAEAWSQSSFVNYLKNIRDFGYPWLNKYKREVILYLKGLYE